MIFLYVLIGLCILTFILGLIKHMRRKQKDSQSNLWVCVRDLGYIPILGCIAILLAYSMIPHDRILDKYMEVSKTKVDTLGTYVITWEKYVETTNHSDIVTLIGSGEYDLEYRVRLFNTVDSTEIVLSDLDKNTILTLQENNVLFSRTQEDD